MRDQHQQLVEIDRFKSLKEAVGELLADSVLIEAGNRLEKMATGPGMMVARVDSFVWRDQIAETGLDRRPEDDAERIADGVELVAALIIAVELAVDDDSLRA